MKSIITIFLATVPLFGCSQDVICKKDCSGHGICETGSCICNTGRAGDNCETCAAGYHVDGTECVHDQVCLESSCSGHGVCDDSTGLVVCTCDQGYTGDSCSDCEEGYQRQGDDCIEVDYDFKLIIPEGSKRCRYGGDSDADEVIEHKARVSIRAGSVLIDRDLEDFSLDWELVEKVELPRDGREAQSLGPGVFWRTIYADQPDSRELYRYDYEQYFEDQGKIFQIIVRLNFYVVNGNPEEPVQQFEDAFVLFSGYLNPYLIDKCVPSVDRGTTMCVANGDRIVLAQRGLDLVWAQFTRGSEQCFVDDFFQLAFGYHHHFFSASYLVVFQEPIDLIDWIYIPPIMTEGAPQVIQYNGENYYDQQMIVPCDSLR